MITKGGATHRSEVQPSTAIGFRNRYGCGPKNGNTSRPFESFHFNKSQRNPASLEARNTGLVGFRIIDLGNQRSDEIVSLFEKFEGLGRTLLYPTENSVRFSWHTTGIHILIFYATEENRKSGICDCLIACSTPAAFTRTQAILKRMES